MAGDKASRVWEEVRRTLGRLGSRTTVHELPPQQQLQAVVKRFDAAMLLTATAGAHEDHWRPQTETVLWAIPSAAEGGRNADLASVATIVSANAALTADAGAVCSLPWRIEGRTPQFWDMSQALLTPPRIGAPSVCFGGLQVQAARAALVFGDVHLVPVPRLAPGKPPRKPAPSWTWTLSPPHLRSDLAILGRLPIFRESLTPAPGQNPADAFAAEKRHLAASAQIAEADVVLLGVFPQVPLAMVEKLSVIGESRIRLQIWLKPAALEAGPRGVKLATIILGRQRSTGRTLQAVSRTAAPNFGSR